jgi:hypothetical protein
VSAIELVKIANQFLLSSLAKDDNKVYGPYKRQSDGRQIVILINPEGKRRTVSYPKYLMEQHLGKELDADDGTVDHINFDKDDNRIENLRVVPRKEHSADDTRRVKLIDLKCDQCQKEFQRSPRLLRDKSKKGTTGIFCSRSCAGKYSRDLQLGKRKEKLPIQPYIESEYYRRKNIKAFLEAMLMKYGV